MVTVPVVVFAGYDRMQATIKKNPAEAGFFVLLCSW